MSNPILIISIYLLYSLLSQGKFVRHTLWSKNVYYQKIPINIKLVTKLLSINIQIHLFKSRGYFFQERDMLTNL